MDKFKSVKINGPWNIPHLRRLRMKVQKSARNQFVIENRGGISLKQKRNKKRTEEAIYWNKIAKNVIIIKWNYKRNFLIAPR